MATQARMFKLYNEEIKPALAKELEVKTIMQVPKITKIVINMGLGKAVNDKKIIKDAVEELSAITGQKVIETYARVSNSSFKVREGMAIGVKVTLRGENMYNFLDKLITIALPRIRDFRGVKHKAFDGRGNFSMGISEFIIFPEVDFDKISSMKGMDISIVTSAHNDEDAFALLAKFGMPFKNLKKEEE